MTSGKEVVLNIPMEEKVTEQTEVTIESRTGNEKQRASNELALLSSRSFSIEETRRYAGSRNDPARMASNFAGVSGANDGRNDIIIRGNSPTGLLWRLEGADIFNPSHFGAQGATGGPVGMLNNNTLDRSDFLTGAFPAEYGNANAGVFDLQMRNGNQDKHEFLGQIGFNGFEAGAEGPFSKKSKASYLVNYRYSTLAAVAGLGLNVGTGTAVPFYQDLSFKVNVPTKKAGIFSLYGVGGFSKISFLGRDSDTTNLYTDPNRDTFYRTRMGVVGLSHLYNYSENTWGQANLYITATKVQTDVDSISKATDKDIPFFRENTTTSKVGLRYTINHKFSPMWSVKGGVYADQIQHNLSDSVLARDPLAYPSGWQQQAQSNGDMLLFQSYAQGLYRPTDRLRITLGLHHQYLSLNGSQAIEPRGGLRYDLKGGQELSLGGGLHSQMQPLAAYFLRTRMPNGTQATTNSNLEFTKAIHTVAGYSKSLGQNTRVKLEAYGQFLYNVPVEQRKTYYSILNEGADFGNPEVDSLVNKGKGQNLGLELTLERSFAKGYYFLITGSLYDSKYAGSNNAWRNTAFNSNYIVNALAGKEWPVSKKLTFGLNTKITLAGGKRFTPINIAASQAAYQTVRYDDRAYEMQAADYFRADLKVSIRHNAARFSQEFFVDVQNITNRKNPYATNFDAVRGRNITSYQLGLFPNVNYKIVF